MPEAIPEAALEVASSQRALLATTDWDSSNSDKRVPGTRLLPLLSRSYIIPLRGYHAHKGM